MIVSKTVSMDDITRLTLERCRGLLEENLRTLFAADGRSWFCPTCKQPILAMWLVDCWVLTCHCGPVKIYDPLPELQPR